MKKLIGFIAVLICATLLLIVIFKSAPNIKGLDEIEFGFPTDLAGVRFYADILSKYYKSQPAYVILLFSAVYLFKQAFCIPGSALLNILAGALFGTKVGVCLCSALTGIGATLAYGLSHLFMEGVVLDFFGDKVENLRLMVDNNRSELMYFLISIRVFPATPNWLINLASPIVGIPLPSYIISVIVGLLPYNFICVSSGSVLAEISDFSEVYNVKTALTLGLLATGGFMTRLISRRIFKDIK